MWVSGISLTVQGLAPKQGGLEEQATHTGGLLCLQLPGGKLGLQGSPRGTRAQTRSTEFPASPTYNDTTTNLQQLHNFYSH